MEYTKGECSCQVILSEHGTGIIYCPKHAAAPELYEALREAEQHLIMCGIKPNSYARRNIKQALAKAEMK